MQSIHSFIQQTYWTLIYISSENSADVSRGPWGTTKPQPLCTSGSGFLWPSLLEKMNERERKRHIRKRIWALRRASADFWVYWQFLRTIQMASTAEQRQLSDKYENEAAKNEGFAESPNRDTPERRSKKAFEDNMPCETRWILSWEQRKKRHSFFQMSSYICKEKKKKISVIRKRSSKVQQSRVTSRDPGKVETKVETGLDVVPCVYFCFCCLCF